MLAQTAQCAHDHTRYLTNVGIGTGRNLIDTVRLLVHEAQRLEQYLLKGGVPISFDGPESLGIQTCEGEWLVREAGPTLHEAAIDGGPCSVLYVRADLNKLLACLDQLADH